MAETTMTIRYDGDGAHVILTADGFRLHGPLVVSVYASDGEPVRAAVRRALGVHTLHAGSWGCDCCADLEARYLTPERP